MGFLRACGTVVRVVTGVVILLGVAVASFVGAFYALYKPKDGTGKM